MYLPVSDPIWQGIGSIISFIIIVFTYLSLKRYRQREQKIEKREIFEKIIQPLIRGIESIIEYVPRSYLDGNYWKWQEIKNNNYYLILRMN